MLIDRNSFDRIQFRLLAAYDAPVRLSAANRQRFVDDAYASWFIRCGSVMLEWGGRQTRVEAGQWFFGDSNLLRSQRFDPDTELVSVRFTITTSDQRLPLQVDGLPLVADHSDTPGLLTLAEATVAACLPSTAARPIALAAGIAQRSAVMQWVDAWLDHVTRLGATVTPATFDDPAIERMLVVLRSDLGPGELPHDRLRAETGLSRAQLDRRSLAALGCTPRRYREQLTLAAAQSALRDSQAAIASIAGQLGFADSSHFGRWFERLTGLRPRAWRATADQV